jgi:hypothetical protein
MGRSVVEGSRHNVDTKRKMDTALAESSQGAAEGLENF